MDKDTRNAIERATQRARRLLENDFASQLEGTFDVLRVGTVAPKAGSHLSPRQVFQRDEIVAAVEHKQAAGMSGAEAVVDYLRDAAFTTLNRFVALKMLEARDLIQECITKGEQSSGYREFCGMAPGVALLPESAGYRIYIESLFDELSTEVKVLFDRRDPASVLWPKRATFEALLDVLNGADFASVWSEDETIGWVYQFFNSGDERRAMREASQAPRNSRELAVRNQFFTPRYVVQFLTDNTLGRIWYEMRGTKTALVERCEYMVRKPGEEFEPRPKKDPRDLRVLDPACGSGHFLLYAFDLFVTIYEEGYADPASPKSEATGAPLAADYLSLAALRQALPGLVLAYNLHGVDIDPRCAQIAALALWLRAQRAWKDCGVAAPERPRIRRTHVVVAEPMPGDATLIEQFADQLNPPLLRDLFRRMVSEMRLAGDLGSLIPVEEGIAAELGRAREQFVKQRHTTGFLPGVEPAQNQGDLDLSGIDDDGFFQKAEIFIVDALRDFAETAAGHAGVRRQLFVGDAAQGVALIDLLRTRFEVVLMNPPFGDGPPRTKEHVARQYPKSANDLGAVFVERGRALLIGTGLLGALTNRTLLAVQGFSEWRRALLEKGGLVTLVDLGHGVLDAMVETAMYVCGSAEPAGALPDRAAVLGLLESHDKAADLWRAFQDGEAFLSVDTTAFLSVPGAPWAYWVPRSLLERFSTQKSFLQRGGQVCQGTATADNFRFYRLRWEVPCANINVAPHKSDRLFEQHRWSPVAKGGEYSLWWDDIHLVVDWGRNGKHVKNFVEPSGKQRSFPKNLEKHYLRGCTYPYRTTSALGMRLLPPGMSFSDGGWGVFAPDGWSDEEVLACFDNRIARYLMEVLLGQGDSSAAGTAARNHVAAAVGGIPWPEQPPKGISVAVRQLIDAAALTTTDETSWFFRGTLLFPSGEHSFATLLKRWWDSTCANWERSAELYQAVEEAVVDSYKLTTEELASVAAGEGPSLFGFPYAEIDSDAIATIFRASIEELIDMAKVACGAKRYTVKKAYYVDRCVDLGAHILGGHPRAVIAAARSAGPSKCAREQEYAALLLSWSLGAATGRFSPIDAGEVAGPSALAALPQQAIEDGPGHLPIWVDDPGHRLDIVSVVEAFAHPRWPNTADDLLRAASMSLGCEDLREWYRQHFFAFHTSAYSKSRRKAPLYWQLSTPSRSYSVWLYYPKLTSDSIHQVTVEVVAPKLKHEEAKLRDVVAACGGIPTAAERKSIAAQEAFVEELRAFLDEVKRVAPLWKPNLDDGVIINFAPLWRLVPHHKPWQKELKATWDSLCAGDYDWAHLAMHLWPETVVPKCASDRSLAIVHGVEDVFWVENADGKWKAHETPVRPVDELIRERSSSAVKAALKSLLDAPTTTGTGRARGRRGASPAATEGGSR